MKNWVGAGPLYTETCLGPPAFCTPIAPTCSQPSKSSFHLTAVGLVGSNADTLPGLYHLPSSLPMHQKVLPGLEIRLGHVRRPSQSSL